MGRKGEAVAPRRWPTARRAVQEPQGGGAHGPSEDAEIARFRDSVRNSRGGKGKETGRLAWSPHRGGRASPPESGSPVSTRRAPCRLTAPRACGDGATLRLSGWAQRRAENESRNQPRGRDTRSPGPPSPTPFSAPPGNAAANPDAGTFYPYEKHRSARPSMTRLVSVTANRNTT